MLHYYAKNFFSPVIASAYEDGGNLKVYVVSDLVKVREKLAVVLGIHSYFCSQSIFDYLCSGANS